MSVITISRGSYSRGREVAEKLSQVLGYECISREIILEASEQFNIPEIKLVRALHDSPSILDRFTYGKERYLAFFRAALLKHARNDNLVYHGLAGHFFLQEIPHVLKIRIIADLEERIKEEMKRENISYDNARHIIVKDDAERRKWGLHVYGVDTWDPRLYDIVLHIKNLTVENAVSNILHTVQEPNFQTTPEGQGMLDNLTLSARVEASLVKAFPKVKADARDGDIFVNIRGSLIDEKSITANVERLAGNVEGVNTLRVNVVPFVIED
ncbi:MAG: cytidylate kinase-like family protein [Desulfobacterales bacterium]|nr:cytidylate kinase-like family protein [Desulfobacterales bacterium]